MTDEAHKSMTLDHDKHLDSLTAVVGALSDNIKDSNHKLESILEILSTQNIIVERINNMDNNIRESFARTYKRVGDLEIIQNGPTGCAALQVEHQKVHDMGKQLSALADDVKDVEDEQKTFVSGAVVRGVMVLALMYIASFGTYVVTSIQHNQLMAHDNKDEIKAHQAVCNIINENVLLRLEKLEEKGD